MHSFVENHIEPIQLSLTVDQARNLLYALRRFSDVDHHLFNELSEKINKYYRKQNDYDMANNIINSVNAYLREKSRHDNFQDVAAEVGIPEHLLADDEIFEYLRSRIPYFVRFRTIPLNPIFNLEKNEVEPPSVTFTGGWFND